jgi:hypothetical protein
MSVGGVPTDVGQQLVLGLGLRPPTDDDVPMTLDWEPLDTREKLVAYLEAINRRRETADGG